MSEHTGRFSGRVEEYRRYRAGYPAAAVLRFLREACGLDGGWRVADVGAGTGMLTEVFLGNGNAVVAVEPNAEMRGVCEELRGRWPALRVVDGTAEATGLGAGSAEMISAGRAFHWFAPRAAAAEFGRVVVPGGWVVLVASGRAQDESARGQELEAILREHGTDYAHVRDHFRRQDGMDAFFWELARVTEGPAVQVRAEFAEERRLDWAGFAGVVQSMSCAPLAGDARFAGMQAALREYFARWSEGGELRMVEVCTVQAGRVAGVAA